MSRKKVKGNGTSRRAFTQEFKQEAVQMLLDGHSTSSVAERLGVTANSLYRWKSEQVQESGPAANCVSSGRSS